MYDGKFSRPAAGPASSRMTQYKEWLATLTEDCYHQPPDTCADDYQYHSVSNLATVEFVGPSREISPPDDGISAVHLGLGSL
jgi:hypothetical protein